MGVVLAADGQGDALGAGRRLQVRLDGERADPTCAARRVLSGGSFVDYIGVDAYQFTPGANSWRKTDQDYDGVQTIAQFAKYRHKPFSVPEWGVSADSGLGQATFIRGIAQALKGDSTAIRRNLRDQWKIHCRGKVQPKRLQDSFGGG